MSLFKRNLCFLLTLFFCLNLFGKGDKDKKKGDKTERDTAAAVVMYGNDMVLSNGWNNYQEHFDQHLDQLLALDSTSIELLRNISLCKKLNSKSPDQLQHMLDSLFTLDQIPYALINEINFQIAHYDYSEDDIDFDFMIPYDDSPYPANYFYKDWNTNDPTPYGYDITQGDSTIMLQLRNDKMNCDFHMPFDGIITSKYGYRDGRNHNGYDIDLEVWDPVHASFGGVVRMAKYYGNYGRLVVIRHYNGLETFYAHLHRFKVKPGDIVEAGDIVGLGGSSGRSTGSHLHYEIRFKGLPLNPAHLISFGEKKLHSDTIILKKSKWGYTAYPKGVRLHFVESGENLSYISQLYGITINDLCADNGLNRRAYLRRGQRLMIKFH